MAGETGKLEPLALRLAKFLKNFVGVRASTIRNVDKYDAVLWFHQMPRAADCQSGAWADDVDPQASWLEVRKQTFLPLPPLPEDVSPWADTSALKKATEAFPPLRNTIWVELEDETDADEVTTVERHLTDHPEIQRSYQAYRPTWESWAADTRRKQEIQKVYAELFQLHTRMRKEGEMIEVLVGFGLLEWNTPVEKAVIPVRRHMVVGNVEVEFAPEDGAIRLRAPEAGPKLRIEDDMLEAELRPERTQYELLEAQLEELSENVWDRAQFDTALRTWGQVLSADNEWHPTLTPPPKPEKGPALSFSPALIVRKRSQAGMLRVYESLIAQLSLEDAAVPHGWKGLVGEAEADSPWTEIPLGEATTTASRESEDTYFPLPANAEQQRIVDAIRHHQGVLVQGPPGTGKSHTIANLICHLLATGQRVLVTAETAHALQVLKDKLPEDIRPLCVNLLGQGGDEFSELNKAIQGITKRQAAYTPGAYDRRIAEIDQELDAARRQLAETDGDLRDLRESETVSLRPGVADYEGTPSKIAERVSDERPAFGWLQLTNNAATKPPVCNEDMVRWLDVLRNDSDEQVRQSTLDIPSSADIPTPGDLSSAKAAEQEARKAADEARALEAHPAYEPLRRWSREKRDHLKQWLGKLEQERVRLESTGLNWLPSALEDLLAGRKGRWETLRECTERLVQSIESNLGRVDGKQVSVSNGHDPRKVRADAEAALAYLNEGGSWKKLGFLTPKELKNRTYLCTDVLIDGIGATTSTHLQIVVDHFTVHCAFEELDRAWSGLSINLPQGTWPLRFADLNEHLKSLQRLHTYAEACMQLAHSMATASQPVPRPDWVRGNAREWRAVLKAIEVREAQENATATIQRSVKALYAAAELHKAHPVVTVLLKAVEERDIPAYSAAYETLRDIEKTRENTAFRKATELALDASVPGLVQAVTTQRDDANWNVRFEHWEKAWDWAWVDQWLRKRANPDYQRTLEQRHHHIKKQIGNLIAETASLRAWTHFFNRLSPKQAEALKAWRETVKAMGKGTGKSAKLARLRREAREYMNQCRDAIPIWVMPRYLVAEMVDPQPERYDHVIVDEASQLGVESLFLFYLGKKMVVVGDDQQISPMGVGVKDEQIAGLIQQYLPDIPHQSLLSAQSSLYANAKIRYSQNIVLREHFRCMPEIIQFSNDLCYAPEGTPLDPLRAYPANRKQPLVRRHVPDGFRKGSTQNVINPPEAEAIVAQIVVCIADPRYAGATMGVISLQGEAQAQYIAKLLMGTLDVDEIEKRRIICGDAYAFQGDERDIIFLSMVAGPGEARIGTLSADSARQRFNVAASRARDQLWLFHSVNLNQLSTKCMRHRLLSYFLEPNRQATEEAEQRFDSEFERAVYRRITDRGFHVRTQVCVGDPTTHRYRIDQVVEGMQGRLAVECDGDRWHGLDRYEQDTARQRDLERSGWQFVRIRGGDFYRDPEEALKPLWEALDQLGIKPGGLDEAAAEPPEPAAINLNGYTVPVDLPQEVEPPDDPLLEAELSDEDLEPDTEFEEERDEDNKEGDEEEEEEDEKRRPVPERLTLEAMEPAATRPAQRPKSFPLPTPTIPASLYTQPAPLSLSTAAENSRGLRAAEHPAQPELFPTVGTPAQPAKYLEYLGKTGPDPREAGSAEVAKGLCEIIQREGPVLARRVYTIYLRGCGVQRMGKELQRLLNRALHHAIQTGKVVSEDEWGTGGLLNAIVRPKGTPPLNVRTLGPRTIEEIPPSELRAVSHYLHPGELHEGIEEAQFRAILDYYGLVRLTEKTRETLRAALTCETCNRD